MNVFMIINYELIKPCHFSGTPEPSLTWLIGGRVMEGGVAGGRLLGGRVVEGGPVTSSPGVVTAELDYGVLARKVKLL